ncbi:hypothetical protein BLA60_12445 [Actinophytocola xinjiangensis]|uniref:OmpR/PhoB-type domain-containing protein n=1 Tax=Actinophytocola xinjiangensis TaxID=485602 RepID=A0A7Z0WPN5_9PSEU|nr:BTAD domain-containing putative transcriptional regulator [Actinophytocola xinjiangensis]OLF11721.1 hypothetical protein BLA60_12445 [Actinophytocola xinjiangensis]
MEFRLLGSLEVWIDERRYRLGGSRQERLLAALLINANSVLTTAKLIDVLWEGSPPETAQRQVHNAIGALRRSLGPARTMIVTDGPGYRADVADAWIDAAQFGHAVDRAQREAAAGDRSAAVRTVSEALRLWRGPALAGLSGYAIETAAARLGEQRLAALELLAGWKLERGEAASIIPELSDAVAEHPLRESLRCQLMLVLCRSGRQSEALAVYEQARTLLAEELGMDPGPDLSRLHQQILRSDAEPLTGMAGGSAEVAVNHAPGPDLTTATGGPNFLPYDIMDFTGRTTEIDRLLSTTVPATGTAVLINALDGMAGTGKTALAVRVAHLLAGHYPDGKLFLDLQGHTPGQLPLSPAAALDLLLRCLGVPAERVPEGVVPRVGRWRSELEGKRVLVVLDNAESAAQVRPLLPGTSGTRVLVTSRRRLGDLEGASSLSLDVLPPDDAVNLFRRVAGPRRTATEPAEVDEVVALCGHLPLAIRIAASRLHNRPSWTVGYLARRLRDGEDRLDELATGDRSVREAFIGSYQHLTAEQRRRFQLLGLHSESDFDVHDAAKLLATTVSETEQLLEDLLDVHLLSQQTAGRYHFYHLLREYARAMVVETSSVVPGLSLNI